MEQEKRSPRFDMFIEEVMKHKVMTKQQELDAFKRLRDGDESAAEEILLSNQRYIYGQVMKFRGSKVPVEDLMQEANIAVMRAIQRFNPDIGVRLFLYSRLWIKQACQRATMEMTASVSLPKGGFCPANKAAKAYKELTEGRQGEPLVSEIVEITGTEYGVMAAAIMGNGSRSIDSTFDGHDQEVHSLINTSLFSEEATQDGCIGELSAAAAIRDAMEQATPRQQQALSAILEHLKTNGEYTQMEVAKSVGVSRQNISQLIFNIRETLVNSPSFMKKHGDLLDDLLGKDNPVTKSAK